MAGIVFKLNNEGLEVKITYLPGNAIRIDDVCGIGEMYVRKMMEETFQLYRNHLMEINKEMKNGIK